MARQTQTFSESWHRVANARVSLRPSVQSRRVHFRGERWHVLEDPFSNQFFRLRPAAYDFLARLDGNLTVEEAWQESLAVHPREAPGQEEVVQLLAQLFHANLIRSDLSPDSAGVFQRYRKRRHREIKSKLQGLLFLRLPLFDPNHFLGRTLPAASWLFTLAGFALWLGVIAAAVKVAIDHWPELTLQSQSVIAPANLPLLYLALASIKLLHEFGHGYACRKFGGEVHVLGVMLLVFTPVPYVDASSSWRFRRRRHRVIVSAAGMYVELLVAACAVFVWAGTGAGFIHSLAYNLIFIASVSTILFNINPLLRFDGYYILSDLLGIPNLNQRANRQWKHLLEKTGFGIRQSISPANGKREAAFYLIWGAVAWVYRLFLFAGILLFVADRFLLLGLLIAGAGLVTWVLVPLFRAAGYLAKSPRLERTRPRALAVTAGLIAAVLAPLAVIPFPHSFSAPGILRSEDYTVVFTQSAGVVQPSALPSGTPVSAGEVVITLENPMLEAEARSLAARLEGARARERYLLTSPGQGLKAIREQIEALENRQREVQRQRGNLEIKAPVAGLWISPRLEHYSGIWIQKGSNVGEIVNPAVMEFAAVVSQKDAAYLFSESIRDTGVKMKGHSASVLEVVSQRIVPARQRLLPSPALGWSSGGDVEVKASDETGREAAESFFEIVAVINPEDLKENLYHGQSGKLRCALAPEPLLPRAIRALRQLMQRRFGL